MIAALVVVGWIAFGVWALSVIHGGSKGPHFRDEFDSPELREFINRQEARRSAGSSSQASVPLFSKSRGQK